MKNSFKKLISALLVFTLTASMLFVFLAPASASGLDEIKETLDGNGDSKINYVALGSSSVSGVGLGGGYKNTVANSYPALVKSQLESTGKTVELSQLGIAGMRPEEIRYLLDESYAGDSYTQENFLGENGVFAELGGVDTIRAEFKNAVANAEFISLEIGLENFLNFVVEYALNNKYDASLDAFDEGIQISGAVVKGRFESVLKGYVEDDDPASAELFQRIIDGAGYALVGYAVNFDEVIANIYKLNPDVIITVANVRNPLEETEVYMPGIDIAIPLSLIYGVLVEIANIYTTSLSEFAGSFNYAYVSDEDRAETFSEQMKSGEYTDEMWQVITESCGELNAAQKQALATILKDAINYNYLYISETAAYTKDVSAIVNSILNAAKEPGFNLATNADYLTLKANKGAMSKLALVAKYAFGGLVTLPNANGHAKIADAIVYATENMVKGSDVIANDMNAVYSIFLDYLDRETLVDLQYAFSPYYVLDKNNSYYVAIGDGSAVGGNNSYVTKLADMLGLNNKTPSKRRYKNLAKEGLTPASVLENFGEYTSELLKADIVTLSFNNASTTAYMIQQLMNGIQGKAVQDNDWSALLGAEFAAEIDKAIASIKPELVSMMGDETIANALVVAAESYAYSYVSRIVSYPVLVDQIHAVTRGNALVVIVGAYNDMADIEVTLDGATISIGKYVQYLIDVANLETLLYSALSEKTAYIACPQGVETKLPNKSFDLTNMSNILSLMNLANSSSYNLTDESHVLVADAVYNTLNIVDPHPHVYQNNCDKRCDVCTEKREVPGHVYDAVCDEYCNECNARNKMAELHVYDSACDSICNVCEKPRESSDHVYSGDCDASCDLCGVERAASTAHTFGEWVNGENAKTRTCSVCGSVESAALDASGSSSSSGLVIVIVCVAVAAIGGGAAVYFLVIKKKPTAAKPEEKKDENNAE